jgi:low affinity Fe/Cu permease
MSKITHDLHSLRPVLHKSPYGGLTSDPDRESPFQRLADWTSAAMGRPTNIMIWLVAVVAWTLTFALGSKSIESGNWLPAWFTSQGFNFPLNLVTTVAELFIGFLVGAASNRSERNLEATLGRIEQLEQSHARLIQENTDLTKAIRDIQIAGNFKHIQAELNIIRSHVAPGVPDPDEGTTATGPTSQ